MKTEELLKNLYDFYLLMRRGGTSTLVKNIASGTDKGYWPNKIEPISEQENKNF